MDAITPIMQEVPELLHTERLTIRPPQPGDGPILLPALQDSLSELRRYPAYVHWGTVEPTLLTCEQYCRESYALFVARRALPFLVLLRGSSVVIGSTTLHSMDWTIPKFEVGFWGRTTHSGQGYLTEGAGTIVAMAFDQLGGRRVEGRSDDLNERSCRLYERLGFKLEGVLVHDRIDPSHTLRTTRVYAKVR